MHHILNRVKGIMIIVYDYSLHINISLFVSFIYPCLLKQQWHLIVSPVKQSIRCDRDFLLSYHLNPWPGVLLVWVQTTSQHNRTRLGEKSSILSLWWYLGWPWILLNWFERWKTSRLRAAVCEKNSPAEKIINITTALKYFKKFILQLCP